MKCCYFLDLNLRPFCSVLTEVRLERRAELWDLQPASFHDWLQTKEEE